jgi:hypothetical protein
VLLVAGFVEQFGCFGLGFGVGDHLPLRDCGEVAEELLLLFGALREAAVSQDFG